MQNNKNKVRYIFYQVQNLCLWGAFVLGEVGPRGISVWVAIFRGFLSRGLLSGELMSVARQRWPADSDEWVGAGGEWEDTSAETFDVMLLAMKQARTENHLKPI